MWKNTLKSMSVDRSMRFSVIVLCGLLGAVVANAWAVVASDDPRVTPVVLAYRNAQPAIVNVSSERVAEVGRGMLGGRDPFSNLFPRQLRRPIAVESLGSGFVIHPSGYVITNAHVVRQANKITVSCVNGIEYPARIISADSECDLAVLKITLPEGQQLPYLPLGRSDDLMPGETVIAIGNPLGYSHSLTTGVISATHRSLKFEGGVVMRDLIQTDAPINNGNSGGPLINIKGEPIGVNTAIRPDAQNIGFAIPIDRLVEELPNLLDFERLNRVLFGAEVAQQRREDDSTELVVTKVRPDSPAWEKLQPGDRILRVNDLEMRQIPDYACLMQEATVGMPLKFSCLRNGGQVEVEITLQPKPRPDGKQLAIRYFGMTLRPLTPELAADLNLPVSEGLLVVGIEPDSPAAQLGVQLKDVIFQFGKLYVTDLDSLGLILESLNDGDKVNLGLIRGNVRAWAPIPVRKKD